MKKYTLLFCLYFISEFLSAQQIEWIISNPIHYTSNPGMVFQTVATSVNGNIITSRLDSSFLNYNQDVFGRTLLECKDASSNVQWSFLLSDSAVVHHIITDANNNVYVGGRFLGTVVLNHADTIFNTSPAAFNEDEFLIKLSSSGNLIWKKNLSINLFFPTLSALAIDLQNNLWFCTTDFLNSQIFKTDANGLLVDSIILENAKSVSSIVFDPSGATYICGATEMGIMRIDTATFNVPDSYSMYVAKLHQHNVDWYYTGHDVTFQSPELASDGAGGVYFAGNLMDSLVWGSVSFAGPQWTTDFFLTRIDSNGNFLWGRSFPVTTSISGRLSINTPGKFLDSDPAGNAVLIGTLNGNVDWGNGVIQQGAIGTEAIHIVSFNSHGIALWQKTGGGAGNYPTAVSISPMNEVYVAAAVTNSCTFDTLTVNNAGTLASIVVKISAASVGINEPVNNFISVYPNPASDHIALPDGWINKTLKIYHIDGRWVKNIKSADAIINIEDLETGNYILQSDFSVARLVVLHY